MGSDGKYLSKPLGCVKPRFIIKGWHWTRASHPLGMRVNNPWVGRWKQTKKWESKLRDAHRHDETTRNQCCPQHNCMECTHKYNIYIQIYFLAHLYLRNYAITKAFHCWSFLCPVKLQYRRLLAWQRGYGHPIYNKHNYACSTLPPITEHPGFQTMVPRNMILLTQPSNECKWLRSISFMCHRDMLGWSRNFGAWNFRVPGHWNFRIFPCIQGTRALAIQRHLMCYKNRQLGLSLNQGTVAALPIIITKSWLKSHLRKGGTTGIIMPVVK